MDDSRPTDAPGGFTLDLSTGAGTPGRRKRKGPAPVVVQTINLSTPRPAPAERAAPAAPPPAAPKPHRGRAAGRRNEPQAEPAERGQPRPRGGTSLADLLDEATLARLRGNG